MQVELNLKGALWYCRKSDDEAQASYKREESDSSVVDPETEGEVKHAYSRFS